MDSRPEQTNWARRRHRGSGTACKQRQIPVCQRGRFTLCPGPWLWQDPPQPLAGLPTPPAPSSATTAPTGDTGCGVTLSTQPSAAQEGQPGTPVRTWHADWWHWPRTWALGACRCHQPDHGAETLKGLSPVAALLAMCPQRGDSGVAVLRSRPVVALCLVLLLGRNFCSGCEFWAVPDLGVHAPGLRGTQDTFLALALSREPFGVTRSPTAPSWGDPNPSSVPFP